MLPPILSPSLPTLPLRNGDLRKNERSFQRRASCPRWATACFRFSLRISEDLLQEAIGFSPSYSPSSRQVFLRFLVANSQESRPAFSSVSICVLAESASDFRFLPARLAAKFPQPVLAVVALVHLERRRGTEFPTLLRSEQYRGRSSSGILFKRIA